MKTLTLLLIIVGLTAISGFSQDPPPPPAPLIYSKPVVEEIRDFVPEDKLFVASFPGVPKISRDEVNGVKVTSYSVYRKGSHSTVAITEYNVDLNSKTDQLIAILRSNVLKVPHASMTVDKNIEFNGRKGHEFEAVFDLINRRIRVFVVGKRIIEIDSDVTNWHIISDKIKEDWRSETERFFNSFKISNDIN